MGTYCITALWLSLSILFTSGIIFSMLSPVWFQNRNELLIYNNSSRQILQENDIISFGLLRHCRRHQLSDVILKCDFYKDLNHMPSISWVITSIVYSIGTGLFVLSIIFVTFGMCVTRENGEKLRVGIAYVQVIAVGFLAISILIFPLGLDSEFARGICGDGTSMYLSGHCEVAWGYALGIMTISLSVFCPILAKYSTEIKDNILEYKSDVISISPSSNSKIMTTV